jgi:hypothetical protein
VARAIRLNEPGTRLASTENNLDGLDSDRQGKADPEQAQRRGVVVLERAEVNPGGVGEDHERQRRFGEKPHTVALGLEIDPAERLASGGEAGRHEEHAGGCGDRLRRPETTAYATTTAAFRLPARRKSSLPELLNILPTAFLSDAC